MSLSRKSGIDSAVAKNSVDSVRESDDVVLDASSGFVRSTELLQMLSKSCMKLSLSKNRGKNI